MLILQHISGAGSCVAGRLHKTHRGASRRLPLPWQPRPPDCLPPLQPTWVFVALNFIHTIRCSREVEEDIFHAHNVLRDYITGFKLQLIPLCYLSAGIIHGMVLSSFCDTTELLWQVLESPVRPQKRTKARHICVCKNDVAEINNINSRPFRVCRVYMNPPTLQICLMDG